MNIREDIENILDKHQVALTKKTEDTKRFGEVEVINFDTVVLNRYEATNELETYINKVREEVLLSFINSMFSEEAKAEPLTYNDEWYPVNYGSFIEDAIKYLQSIKENL